MSIEFFEIPSRLPNTRDLLGTCYLCGSQENLTQDHVIPKVLFRLKPNGNAIDTDKVITLDACEKCNQAKALDDEYVSRYLQAASVTEPARKAFDRFVKRKRGKGILGDMGNRFERRTVTNPSSVLAHTNQAGFTVDKARFENYFTCIAKGLYTANSKELFDWEKYKIFVAFEQLLLSNYYYNLEVTKKIWRSAAHGQYWRHTLAYRGHINPTDSAWSMLFYGAWHAVIVFEKLN